MQAAIDSGKYPTAEQQLQYEAAIDSDNRILTVAGDVAQINIEGVLTNKPDWIARFFGGGNTTYAEIQQALATAAADRSIRSAVLNINSGGGSVIGLFDTLAAIEAFPKPVTARIGGMGASAAYAIAAQADKIYAANPATMVGSVGVAVAIRVSPDIVDIASSNAPNKRPDASTEEGQAVIRAELDDIEEVFIASIAEGRKTDVAKVKAEFGQGGILLAGEAVKRGMIDAITEPIPGTATNTKNMTLEELKANHPNIYSAVFELGVSAGVDKERDRVKAHVIMGDANGAHELACKAIKEGSEMSETLKAEYAVAGMTSKQLDAQASDSQDMAAADKAKAAEGKSPADQVFEAFNKIRSTEGVI